MKFTVHRPKLLVFVLLAITLVGSSISVYASERPGSQFTVFPGAPTAPKLTSDQEEKAKELVNDSNVVTDINGGQEWRAVDFYLENVGGREVVGFRAEWEKPATSSGPWTTVICQGTRKTVGTMEFTNITRLVLHADTEKETVVSTSIAAPPGDQGGAVPAAPNSQHKVEIYDAKSGDRVYDGPILEVEVKCESGTEDD